MLNEISAALLETLYMLAAATFFSVLIALPLGIYLYICQPNGLKPKPWLYAILDFIINVGRSLPFIILLIVLLPFTRLMVGTSIGTTAAIVPLTIGAIPFLARMIENNFNELSQGLIEAGLALGASHSQLIFKILLPEATASILQSVTVLVVNLVGYTAMAGTIGGGGLGDLAIRYGYQRFDTQVMIVTVVILVVIVQILQRVGDGISRWFRH